MPVFVVFFSVVTKALDGKVLQDRDGYFGSRFWRRHSTVVGKMHVACFHLAWLPESPGDLPVPVPSCCLHRCWDYRKWPHSGLYPGTGS